jgi:Cof subfamily protein (haloacid dehalogenase superfamily)
MSDRIRLLLSDVDGTLVTGDKRLTEETKAAARELREAGVILAITSSRAPRGMSMLIGPLALQGAIGGFNGGVIVNPDLSVIERHPLDPPVAREVLNLIEGQGLDAWLFTDGEWLVRNREAPYVDREIRTLQFEPRVVDSFTDVDIARAVKIVGVSRDFHLMTAGEKEAQNRLGEKVNAARSQPYYLDVTHPKANKGEVAATLSRLWNIPLEQIATIGDMPNDVRMFRRSGFSIAMGNASDEVKAQANVATDSNENDGFAKAVRSFILPRAGS